VVEDDASIRSVTLDAIHRHYPVVLFVLITGVSWGAALNSWEWGYLWRMLLVTALLALIFGVMWHGQCRRRIILSSGGVVVKGWFFETVVHLHLVKRVEASLDDDSLGVASPWDDGIGEFFISLFAQFTVRPMRWILRRTIYGGKSDVFYRGILRLYDMDKKVLLEIEASDGWRNIEEMFTQITHRIEQRARQLSAPRQA